MNATDPEMKPTPQREEALFQAAAQLNEAERAVFLNGDCLGDPALRRRLDALLSAHEQPAGVLADGPALFGVPPSGGPATPPAEAGTPSAPAAKATIKLDLADAPDEAVGQTLGRCKLLERVGEGGCGVVYVPDRSRFLTL